MQVAQAAFAALREQGLVAIVRQVGNLFAGVDIGNHCAHRHAQNHIVRALAVAIRAAAGFAVLGAVHAGETVVHQGVDVAIRNGVD